METAAAEQEKETATHAAQPATAAKENPGVARMKILGGLSMVMSAEIITIAVTLMATKGPGATLLRIRLGSTATCAATRATAA